jgi:hypothetical protein
MALQRVVPRAFLLTLHHRISLRESRKLFPGHPFDQAAMTAPQTFTLLSVPVLTLVSSLLLCLSDLPRVLVRFVVIHLSIHPHVDDRQVYPIQIPSQLLRATRSPSRQSLEDRLHPLRNPFITLNHLDNRCHQKSH